MTPEVRKQLAGIRSDLLKENDLAAARARRDKREAANAEERQDANAAIALRNDLRGSDAPNPGKKKRKGHSRKSDRRKTQDADLRKTGAFRRQEQRPIE